MNFNFEIDEDTVKTAIGHRVKQAISDSVNTADIRNCVKVALLDIVPKVLVHMVREYAENDDKFKKLIDDEVDRRVKDRIKKIAGSL